MIPPAWTPDLDAAARSAPRGGTIEDWKAHAEGLLSEQPCVFHRNGEITALYAALYLRHPERFKWAGMAAFASHHARHALWPLRLGADRSGAVDLPRAIGRWQALRMDDVDRIRRTNNGIFDDVFWVHLAYDGRAEGLDELRRLMTGDEHYEPVLRAFETMEDPAAVWEANVEVLRHEQCALVQPHFNRLSNTFARAFSFGATLGFEVSGLRRSLSFFTSFYAHSLFVHPGRYLGQRRLPLVTRFDDRWEWIDHAIVPRFQRYESEGTEMRTALRELVAEAEQRSASGACEIPPIVSGG